MARITKALKATFKTMAEELANTHNPYKDKAIRYYVDGDIRYIYNNKTYTEQGIKDAYVETALHDIENGYSERAVGYYDKWYRYSHSDEGRAYDKGQKYASETLTKIPENVIFY